jgi:hypothetical protein
MITALNLNFSRKETISVKIKTHVKAGGWNLQKNEEAA